MNKLIAILPLFSIFANIAICAPSKAHILFNPVTAFAAGGHVGERLTANEHSWIDPLLKNNPDLFGAFLRPDSNTLFKCMWHGEFPGKILAGVAQTYMAFHRPATLAVGQHMVDSLARAQRADGYLGPWSNRERFENQPEKWDTWGHYHCMYGLYQWYKATGDTTALRVALRAADCVYNYFIAGSKPLSMQNWSECNYAVSHIFALLYEEVHDKRYLQAALHIVSNEWKIPYHDFYTNRTLACNWLEAAMTGTPFCNSTQRRWESLYTLSTLASLYRSTARSEWFDAMSSLWWGIVQHDRHNSGSFGTGEGATGDIYGAGSETCNTVAWMTFSTEFLHICADPYVADELELSYYNATLGSQVTDKEFVYMNLSDGTRTSSQIVLANHSYTGGREMNCCQASGNRGLSQFTQWGLLSDGRQLYLNYYGEASIDALTPKGHSIRIDNRSDYPRSGAVLLTVNPGRAERFGINLRIPRWSEHTTLSVNGRRCTPPTAGTYCHIERTWHAGDHIELTLDMRPHYWVGEGAMKGRTSVYIGPVLLSVEKSAEEAATLRFTTQAFDTLRWTESSGKWLCAEAATTDGRRITVEDYATKQHDAPYTSWLYVDGDLIPVAADRATRDRPVWDNRPGK